MSDEEIRTSAESLLAAIKESNARFERSEDERRADEIRIGRLEEAMVMLTTLNQTLIQLVQNGSARQDVTDARVNEIERGREEMQQALSRLTNTVDRYINARGMNGDGHK